MNPYNNTVEVLSPNPPSEPTVEDQSFRTTKDDLLQQISKVILMAFLVDYMKIIDTHLNIFDPLNTIANIIITR